MSAEAIFHVTLALRTRLHQALIAAGDPGAVFVGPLDDPDAQGASLNRMSSPTLRNRELGTTSIDAPTHSHSRANGDTLPHNAADPILLPEGRVADALPL